MIVELSHQGGVLRCDEQLYLIPIVSYSFLFIPILFSLYFEDCGLLFASICPQSGLSSWCQLPVFLSLTVKLITRLVVLLCILQYIIIDSEADHQSDHYLPWHSNLDRL
jgi:hypothetical protein